MKDEDSIKRLINKLKVEFPIGTKEDQIRISAKLRVLNWVVYDNITNW